MAEPADDMLVEYLAQYEARCPLCRYNLRGLQRAQCPECGKALVLTVGLREPFYAAWITAAGASFACAGVGVFFLVAVILAGFPRTGGVESLLTVVICMFIAAVPLAVAVLVLRRRFLRLERTLQWMLGLSMLGGGLLLFTALIVLMFIDMP